MTKDIFRSWCFHFVKSVKPAKQSLVVLVLDGFKGHLDCDAFEVLHFNNVLLIGLPSHTSDKTQPLGLSVFGPLKIANRNQFDSWLLQNYDVSNLHDFTGILFNAYKKAYTPDNISSGFAKAGLKPYNHYKIL